MNHDEIKTAAERWVDDHGERSDKFVSAGWKLEAGPAEWNPEADAVMHSSELWKKMRDCLAKLPQKAAAIFTMRKMDDNSGRKIYTMPSISDNYLWVMLHRARMALGECLEMNWFEAGEKR